MKSRTASPLPWTPADWRTRPVPQMPSYDDPAALAAAEQALAARPPLVTPAACRALADRLAVIGAGRGVLVQGGDCAESFNDFTPDKVAATAATLKALAAGVPQATVVARMAGQFAKPRSADTETRAGMTLPVYRGDAINDFTFSPEARRPAPERMVQAYDQAQATLALLDVYTCHEALLLPYEQALTRFDEDSGQWYATSAHFLWLGARTQKPDDAHVAYLRGIANPLGIKCAPWTDADALLRLIDILNPGNRAGRLTLIPRLGAAAIDDCLPPLIDAVKRAGSIVTWCCDPMHGNTIMTADGTKTRRLEDMKAELIRYFAIHRAFGTWPGGVHLEVTGQDVTECIGGNVERPLPARYETRCDPRLNPAQAQELAALAAAEFAKGPNAA